MPSAFLHALHDVWLLVKTCRIPHLPERFLKGFVDTISVSGLGKRKDSFATGGGRKEAGKGKEKEAVER